MKLEAMQPFTRVEGSGPPVVLLHGFLSSSRVWNGVTVLLKERFTILRMDLLGFGRSPKPNISYTLDTHLQSVINTIEAQHFSEKIIFGGQSIGALLAIAYTAKYPDRVKKLVLVSPPLFTSTIEAKQQIRQFAGSWYMISRGFPGYVAHAIEQLLKPFLIRFLPKISRRYKKEVLVDTFAHTWNSYSSTLQHLIYTPQFYSLLERITVPTIIFYGADDPFIIPKHLKALEKKNKYVSLIKVQGKHQFIYENTEEIAQAIVD